MAIDARGSGSSGRTRYIPNNMNTEQLRAFRISEHQTPIPPKTPAKPKTPSTTSPGGNRSGGGGGGSTTTPAKGKVIKIADSNLFIDQAQPSVEDMATAIFEEIGGHELIGIVANDKVNPIFDLNGETSSYQPISNLSAITVEYSPQQILKLQDTDLDYFKSFPISLDRFIPDYANGVDGTNVYTDDSGNLIIEFANMRDDLRVQVEVLSYSNVISDTIY